MQLIDACCKPAITSAVLHRCISWGPDPEGVNGVFLGKDVPLQVNSLGCMQQFCQPGWLRISACAAQACAQTASQVQECYRCSKLLVANGYICIWQHLQSRSP